MSDTYRKLRRAKTFPPVKRGPHHGSPECEKLGNRIQKRRFRKTSAEDLRTGYGKESVNDRDRVLILHIWPAGGLL